MYLAVSVIVYFAAAALLGLAGRRLGRAHLVVALLPFAAQLGVVAAAVRNNGGGVAHVEWLPSLGVALSFRTDPLSLLLTTVVAGIGLVIAAYSGRYFSDPADRNRFLALMLLFTGGMAGLVAVDDVFGLFVFWEVTTVASYLLIGFNDTTASARAAAVQAVLVTTAGGLAMLGGFVLLTTASGSSSISEIVASPPSGTMATVSLLLILIGAFTKSAQFPFHFWLPGAMAAPTPASAYLHSATMVKAGIVLLILVAPAFADSGLWSVGVTGVGLITMTLGAIQALRQHDLKLLLAHSTVSQLGFMVALLGAGLRGIAVAVLVAHAAFKATLFLVVGIIDKKTGTRDIRHLAGLRRTSPVVAVIAGLAALSMAGIPPLLGFVTKEAAFDALIAAGRWVPLVTMALASVLTVAYTARFWWGAFEELPGGADVAHLGRLDRWLIGPPTLLAAASLTLGVWPGGLGSFVADATDEPAKLVLWPGWKPALAVSAAVLAAGAALHVATHRGYAWPGWMRRLASIEIPTGTGTYRAAVRGLNRTADTLTGIVQSGSLPAYLGVILTAIFGVTGAVWLYTADAAPSPAIANGPAEVLLGATAIVAAIVATRSQRRMAAALLLGVVGFAIAGVFVTFGAPDLALTQLLIETFTVALFAFVLSRLPRRFGADPASVGRTTRLLVAGLSGGFVTIASLLATATDTERAVAEFYVDSSVEAGGRNVVNVILTDFRALDTLGEITVLVAAGLGIAALVTSGRRVVTRHQGES